MPEPERSTFQLSLAEVEMRAPETRRYLEVALRLLETRMAELPDAAQTLSGVGGTPVRAPAATPTAVAEAPAGDITLTSLGRTEPASAAKPSSGPAPTPEPQRRTAAPGRRARWFQDRFPRITLPDGAEHAPRSLEELKELLGAGGLTPHPRGDASMLLWQVRNRLGGQVEVVGVGE